MFPSFSHSQAAAIEPIIEAVKKQLVIFKTNVPYAKSASPAPTGSIMIFVKLSRA